MVAEKRLSSHWSCLDSSSAWVVMYSPSTEAS